VATIELRRVEKRFDDVYAVRSLDLDVDDGELLVLLGPSGCGKSTVLRMVAGLESVTAGEIFVGGRRVDTVPAQERDVAMVFQSYALYGHMSVRRNLEFPLRMRGVPRGERRRRAEEIAALLELTEQLEARPATLSGGQQQRVAMGRALVREPRAFLLDEPLSNLDARLRGQVRAHIAEIQDRLGVTTLYVTHDQVEALALGHRVAVLREGALQQIGAGQELYDKPANTFVAQFLGQPGMNLLRGWLGSTGDGPAEVRLGAGTSWRLRSSSAIRPATPGRNRSGRSSAEREVIVGVRPEAVQLVDPGEDGALPAEVRAVEELGPERLLHLSCDVRTVEVMGPSGGARSREGREVTTVVARRGTGGAAPRPGRRVGLKVAPRELHLFDTEGKALRGREF
jgi:multiple sugar transport system ATP-binding protein